MNKRIGIIGGTFNPIHIAHLIIAEIFYYQVKIDECFFVPTNISPFKLENSDELVSAEHRIEMLRLSLSDNKKFGIDYFEINRNQISYTIKTIEYFSQKFRSDNLFLLIGDDQAQDFQKWKEWEKILESVQICIARREIVLSESEKRNIDNKLTLNQKTPIWLDNPLLDISSKSIRERIRNNKPYRYLVTKEVELYIRNNALYKKS